MSVGQTKDSITVYTADHSTVNPTEVARVEAAGGKFVQKTMKAPGAFPFCCKMVEKNLGKPRVQPGGLLVTRSFGDFQAKLPVAGGVPGNVIHDFEEIKEVRRERDSTCAGETLLKHEPFLTLTPFRFVPLRLPSIPTGCTSSSLATVSGTAYPWISCSR